MIVEKVKDKVRKAMRNFLKIDEAQNSTIYIQESITQEINIAKNRIWYRGDSYELDQLYKQINNNNHSFWGTVPTVGMEIRKIHTGLPKLIVNTLVNIVHNDLNSIDFDNEEVEEILKENKKRALALAVTVAFSVSAPSILVGCGSQKQEEDEEDDTNTSSSSGGSGSHWYNFGGSDSNSKSKSSNSKSSTGSKSSGYSGVKGGSASS